jgi:hypothetical protein
MKKDIPITMIVGTTMEITRFIVIREATLDLSYNAQFKKRKPWRFSLNLGDFLGIRRGS